MATFYDVLVVVDDWHGRGAFAFAGRSFPAASPELANLKELLRRAGAADWHASGDRDKFGFLFDSPEFYNIIASLEAIPSFLFEVYIPAGYDAPLREFTDRVLQEAPESTRQVFQRQDRSNRLEARSLLHFLVFTSLHVRRLHPDARSVLVIVDRMSWLIRTSVRPFVPLTIVRQVFDVGAISDKNHPDVRQYLPFLGLIDSEIWFFARYFNQLTFKDGTTIGERLSRLHATGSDAPVFTDEEFSDFIAPHKGHAKFLKYLELWPEWYRRGLAFNVAMTSEEAAEAARLVTEDIEKAGQPRGL